MPVAFIVLGFKPWEFTKLTIYEFQKLLKVAQTKAQQEHIQRVELVTLIVNACGCNLKTGVKVQDLLGFDPYKKKEVNKKSGDELKADLEYLKNKLGGDKHGR